MKKITSIFFVFFLTTCLVSAEIRVLEKYFLGKNKEIREIDREFLPFSLYTVCIDGFKFLILESKKDNNLSSTQILGQNGPEKCSTKK